MAKRRRERDKPKASNDALYNPNKRVLLSYGSDEDAELEDASFCQPFGTGHPLADTKLANYKIVEYGSDDDDDENEEKRRNEDEVAEDSEAKRGCAKMPIEPRDQVQIPDNGEEARPRSKSHHAKWGRTVSRNVATGQWPALGSLAYQWDEECDGEEWKEDEEQFSGSDEEAMAYLREVR